MTKQGEICVILKDRIVTYDDSQETRNAVFNRVIDWYFMHGSFSGESIVQSDDPSIDAPNILAQIADDIIKFNVVWIE